MNLGRVDQVDVDGQRRPAASISNHFDDVDLFGDAQEAVAGAAPLEAPKGRKRSAATLRPQGAPARRQNSAAHQQDQAPEGRKRSAAPATAGPTAFDPCRQNGIDGAFDTDADDRAAR